MSNVEDRINELAKKLPLKLGVRKELKKLPSLLLDNEDVMHLDSGMYGGGNGLVVVTDRRVMFVLEGVVKSRLEDFPYERISSVQTQKGLIQGQMTIFASGNKAEISRMTKGLITEIGDYIRHRIAQATQGGAAAAVPAPTVRADPIDRLKKLAELRDIGALSAEEFEEQKAKILAEI